MPGPEPEREEADRAASEAAQLGGRPSREPAPADGVDESERPLVEAGQGEAEGFEEAERELIEHSSHGDQHAARRAIQDAPLEHSDDARVAESGEADRERSSERDEEAGPGEQP
jgi:hypothetical protein